MHKRAILQQPNLLGTQESLSDPVAESDESQRLRYNLCRGGTLCVVVNEISATIVSVVNLRVNVGLCS
jgi:hypothetical protein